jgi:hypothetical protein
MADHPTMGDDLIAVLEGATVSLLEELAAVRAESECLRRELEQWGTEDERPTIPVPRLSNIDTLRCAS